MKKLFMGLACLGLLVAGCTSGCPQAECPACEPAGAVTAAGEDRDAGAKPSDHNENAGDEVKNAAESERPKASAVPETNDMQEVFGFLKAVGTYYIATAEGDQPRVRPFGTVEIYDGHLYFQTGKKKNVAHQIDANPKVEICAFDGTRWIRLSGTAVEDARAEAQAHMLDAYPQLKSMYAVGDGNTVVYYLKDATARISSFGAPEREIKF